MDRPPPIPVVYLLMLGVMLVLACAAKIPEQLPGPSSELPGKVLWAWERPEDLRFLDPRRTAVAVLVATLGLIDQRVEIRSRHQPLAVATASQLVAVVRIESSSRHAPRLSAVQRADAVEAILAASQLEGAVAVQIDFDAVRSERSFYGDLLVDLRRRLPASKDLTITALASWCLGDAWLADLPIDDAVPMLFRMGTGGAGILQTLDRGQDFHEKRCRGSLGLSTDEPWPALDGHLAGRRLYLFHPQSWTRQAWAANVESRP